ncbi:MAG: type II CRISPR-associated endonuclease Cas1 [Lachnospiraceae bacterium]
MGYRNIMISNPMQLHIKNQQLILGTDEEIKIPMEDINCILIETQNVQVSAYFLQQAAELGVAVFVCDRTHTPNGVLLPLVRHSRHYHMLKNQMTASKPFQKRLWQQIIVQKIKNQAKCLELNGLEGAQELEKMSRQVQSGDRTNQEAAAALFYFRRLFGDTFVRRKECLINAALNYGYALVRGLLARTIICYGFEPAIGIFHHSEVNSYNLADDLIEPFRPMIDLYVSQHFTEEREEERLTPEDKRGLFQILSYDMNVCGESHSLSNSIEKLVMSFSSCMEQRREELWVPELISLQIHEYE